MQMLNRQVVKSEFATIKVLGIDLEFLFHLAFCQPTVFSHLILN